MIKTINKKAFTLVELAIVVALMALIIGMVVKVKNAALLSKLTSARMITKTSPVKDIDGLILWLDATSKDGFNDGEDIDGASVLTWRDLSRQTSVAHNVTAASTSVAPIYDADSINGLPALVFDGVNDVMSTENWTDMVKNDVTIFLVGHINNTTTGVMVSYFQSSSFNNLRMISNLNKLLFDFYDDVAGGRLTSTSNVVGANNIFTVTKAITGTQTIYINGAQDATQTNTNTAFTAVSMPLHIGARDAISSSPCAINIGEIIIYDRALKDYEREDVERYLSKKWKIDI
ncbi:MAG: prepilin-type N-terminal cleavage/methylation domain-containing protein [Proteobacteria bacterium]|nr:prepilin-type N-terminal cleavage/methylation domain-containing protein [Pseudomonadota bacterium]